jgi:hypothetical protein
MVGYILFFMSLNLDLRTGSFHKSIGVPKDQKIPAKLEDAIDRTELCKFVSKKVSNGKTRKVKKCVRSKNIKNPTSTGNKKIRVTKKLQQKSRFARNARSWKHGSK